MSDAFEVRPAPTDDEAVAIAAALVVGWPQTVVVAPDARRPASWRFSGRWWARPVAARRDRPWV